MEQLSSDPVGPEVGRGGDPPSHQSDGGAHVQLIIPPVLMNEQKLYKLVVTYLFNVECPDKLRAWILSADEAFHEQGIPDETRNRVWRRVRGEALQYLEEGLAPSKEPIFQEAARTMEELLTRREEESTSDSDEQGLERYLFSPLRTLSAGLSSTDSAGESAPISSSA